MKVPLTQIDGKLPNLALMKIAHHHRANGNELYFTKHVERGLLEPSYQRVYFLPFEAYDPKARGLLSPEQGDMFGEAA